MYCSSLIPYEYCHLFKIMTVEGDVAMLIQMVRFKKKISIDYVT